MLPKFSELAVLELNNELTLSKPEVGSGLVLSVTLGMAVLDMDKLGIGLWLKLGNPALDNKLVLSAMLELVMPALNRVLELAKLEVKAGLEFSSIELDKTLVLAVLEPNK